MASVRRRQKREIPRGAFLGFLPAKTKGAEAHFDVSAFSIKPLFLVMHIQSVCAGQSSISAGFIVDKIDPAPKLYSRPAIFICRFAWMMIIENMPFQ